MDGVLKETDAGITERSRTIAAETTGNLRIQILRGSYDSRIR